MMSPTSGAMSPRVWEWLALVVLAPIAGILLLEHLTLPDGWRGSLELLTALVATAALALWVRAHGDALRAGDARRRRPLSGRGPAARSER
jgi:hypothetical protein